MYLESTICENRRPPDQQTTLSMSQMQTIDGIRRENAKALAKSEGSNAAFARKIGREPTQVSRFIGKNPTVAIGDDLARHIEESFKLPRGWLDNTHKTPNQLPAQHTKNSVPHFTSRELNQDKAASSSIECPFPHSTSTYAFTVDGSPSAPSAMHPTYGKAYPVGSIVFVDPELANECDTGDIVAIVLVESQVHTFRLLSRDDTGTERLFPLNGNFPEVTQSYKIVGKVIGAIIP